MTAISFTAALAKGYPEFDPDQPRDEGGRFSGGGGTMAAVVRVPKHEREKLVARHKEVFGYPPPKSMSGAKLRGKLETYDRLREEHRRGSEYIDSIGRSGDPPIKNVSRAAAALDAASRKLKEAAANFDKKPTEDQGVAVGKAGVDVYDTLRRVDDDVWRSPTFADYAMRSLMDFGTVIGASLFGLATVWGVAAASVGIYLAMRYAYRKVTTLGRYRGVRWGSGIGEGRLTV